MKTAAGIDRVIGFVTKFQSTILSGCSVYGIFENLVTNLFFSRRFAKHPPIYNLLTAGGF
jgi:hypothetical protein